MTGASWRWTASSICSPAGAHPVSFANLFTDLCRLLPERRRSRLLQRYGIRTQTPAGLMLALLEAFPAAAAVVLLDNFEDLLDPATGRGHRAGAGRGACARCCRPRRTG